MAPENPVSGAMNRYDFGRVEHARDKLTAGKSPAYDQASVRDAACELREKPLSGRAEPATV